MATHPQTWIKVNAPVDEGVAEIVSLLNTVDGLETLQSCQGEPGDREGYVYFSCGNWKRFEEVGIIQPIPGMEQITYYCIPIYNITYGEG